MSRTYKKDCLFKNSYKDYSTYSKRKTRGKYGKIGKEMRRYRNKQIRSSNRIYETNCKVDTDYSDRYLAKVNKKTLMWDIW